MRVRSFCNFVGTEIVHLVAANQLVSSPEVPPEIVISDVDLTMSLTAALFGASGMMAIAHAVEAPHARDGNPVVSLMAKEAIGVLARALPMVVAQPQDREARSDAAPGCAAVVPHARRHVHLPHAETHTVALPYALAHNALAIPEVMGSIAEMIARAYVGAPPQIA
jgi:alcohol dehydrogenase class IV